MESTNQESVRRTLRVDVYENDQEILLVADLPGVGAEALKVELDQGELTIDASTPAEGTFGAQRWQRVFGVPRSIRAEDVKAEVHDGVLRVTLPRSVGGRRTIPIASA